MIVLLAVKPGPLRDGLDALLYATPDVQLVAHANDTSAALTFCQQHPTKIIIFEIRPGERELLENVAKIKELGPQSHVLALINEEQDREPAEQSGADVVLASGMQAAKLKKLITELAASVPNE